MRFLTSGESHGKRLTLIVEGLPSNIPISLDEIDKELSRRRLSFGRSSRMKIEEDKVEILSGVRKGLTTGAPLTISILNAETSNLSEEEIEKKFGPFYKVRPGHADLPGVLKFSFNDARNVLERASARATVLKVAFGSIAKQTLKTFGVGFASAVLSVGKIASQIKPTFDLCSKLPLDFPFIERNLRKKIVDEVENARKEGETLGGKVFISAKGVIAGIGSYTQWDRRVDAKISYALMSIPSVKGIFFGAIEETIYKKGSLAQDEIEVSKKRILKRKTNYAGGIEGGMSNGEDIDITLLCKPLSSSYKLKGGVDIRTFNPSALEIPRSDTVALFAICVIGEALLAITILDLYLEKFGGDSIYDTINSFKNYCKRIGIK